MKKILFAFLCSFILLSAAWGQQAALTEMKAVNGMIPSEDIRRQGEIRELSVFPETHAMLPEESLTEALLRNTAIAQNQNDEPELITDRDYALKVREYGTIYAIETTTSTQPSQYLFVREAHTRENNYIDSVKYTLYDPEMKEDITFTLRTDTMRANDVRILGGFSRRFFNTNANNKEFMVFVHHFEGSGGPANQRYTYWAINEQGEILHKFENTSGISLYQNNNTRKIIASAWEYINRPLEETDTTTFTIYNVSAGYSAATVSVTAEHRIGSKNLVSFDGPLLNTREINGTTYYFFPHYKHPFWVGVPSDNQSTPNNAVVFDMFNINNNNPYKRIELPLVNWENGTQGSFGMAFDEYDMTDKVFNDDDNLEILYGVRHYQSNHDSFYLTFYLADENGNILKSIDRPLTTESISVKKMADLAGQDPLYALMEADGSSISAITTFDILNWEYKHSFGAVYEGEKISLEFDRIAYDEEYVILFYMAEPVIINEDVCFRINYYSKEGVFLKDVKFNLGPLGLGFSPLIRPTTLNPYMVNSDSKLEFLGISAVYTSASKESYVRGVSIYNEDGELLYHAGNNTQLGEFRSSPGVYSVDGGKTIGYLVIPYAVSSTESYYYFYKFPFSTFAGGDGSEGNPYVIREAGDLDAVRYYPKAHYVVANDIDMAPILNTKYNMSGWPTIPDFSGSIDGQNHVIRNLDMKSSDYLDVALFASLSGNARIENLKIEDASILTGNSAAFITLNMTGTSAIRNVHITGDIGFKNDISGLIGTISADMNGIPSGGKGPVVEQCSFEGTIDAGPYSTTVAVGGIVGRMRDSAAIINCLSRGTITMTQRLAGQGVGGVIGTMRNASTIKNCYSTMNITATANVGGIVGLFDDDSNTKGIVRSCYATGRIIATGTNANNTFAGGVIGSTSPNWTHEEGSPPNAHVNRQALNMSGLMALNDSVTSVNANRVSGKKNEWDYAMTDYGVPTLDSIVNCYALATLKVGAAGAETTISSSDPASIDGANIAAADITQSFLSGIGWLFGMEAASPWVWIDGQYPLLWFEITAQSVSLNESAVTLAVDSTFRLVATVYPEVAPNKNVLWTSSNEAVATVADGLLTGTGEGSATITVTTEDGGHTATCIVTVFEETPEIIHLTINNEEQEAGETEIHYAGVCGDNQAIVTIDAVGRVSIRANGQVYANGEPVPLTGDKTTILVEVSTSAATLTSSLHIARALGSAATPLFVQRWGNTLAIINNPANNGGHTFDGYRWYNNGVPMSETGRYIPLNGQPIANYTADVHSTVTAVWHQTCPNVANVEPADISVYPNPVKAGQTIHVVLPQEIRSAAIRIIDINGNTVRLQKNVKDAVSAPAQSGMYLLQIQSPDGNVSVQKIIVE